MSALEAEPIDPFGPEAHAAGAPEHSGKRGHYCAEWDGLWICEDCEEFKFCNCWGQADEQGSEVSH